MRVLLRQREQRDCAGELPAAQRKSFRRNYNWRMSTYSEELSRMNTFSMDDFIEVSCKLLAPEYRRSPWEYVKHETNLLSSEQELFAYVAAYGEMHQNKCHAAFQNFKFDDLQTNFEVIDWACGQGVATITFCDMLKERDKLRLLRKITLIEPSLPALRRAKMNVEKTHPQANVMVINKYLPGDGSHDELVGVDYHYSTVIHLFSNILDIESVNLIKLAHIVAEGGNTHYIVCMGPMNSGSYRIDQFCSIFNADSCFSRIAIPRYGVTTRTHHTYSCRTNGIKYTGGGLNVNNTKNFTAPTLINGNPVIDDYDPNLLVQNKVLSHTTSQLYASLATITDTNDSIFLKPNINGDTPDIVIVRPYKGVLLLQVYDGSIDEKEKVKSAIESVKQYQENLIKLHVENMLGLALIRTVYWRIVKTAIYFSRYNQDTVNGVWGEKDDYTCLLGNDAVANGFFKNIGLEYNDSLFDRDICNSFYNVLSLGWHSYKQGKHINLTSVQDSIVNNPLLRRKISGVAGSGKTQVLAFKAINTHLRTGRKVLILSFNLTLVNYIKYRINEIRADFSWSNILITNYHQLIKSEANNKKLKLSLKSFDDINFFDGVKDRIEKFSAIFIDEVQDYLPEWLHILDKYFVEKDAEFIVFGDARQNIYKRSLDSKGQVNIGFIRGSWNNELNKGIRFSNVLLSDLAMKFQKEFYKEYVSDIIINEQASIFNSVKYYYVRKDTDAATLQSNCLWLQQNFGSGIMGTVILAQSCDILRDIDFEYRQKTHQQTLTTFESAEQYEELKKRHHIGENDTQKSYLFNNDVKQIRRNKKLHFTMGAKCLKLSTIHSFKGWEADTVILIIEPVLEQVGELRYAIHANDNSRELIYTAITRAKENLFILNMGNEYYHTFFSREIKNR